MAVDAADRDMECFDYVIAGGGTAGCVLAARLSEDPNVRVLLLEAGSTAPRLTTLVPGLLWSAIKRYDWRYPAEPDRSRNGAAPDWIAGKLLGGGSSINGMMFVRGLPVDYDAWAEAGGPHWRYEALLDSFRMLETFSAPERSEDRGTAGPVSVVPIVTNEQLTAAFVAACVAQGLTEVADINAAPRGVSAVGRGQTNQRRGRRASTARAYLAPARSRRNLVIRGHCEVQRVILKEGSARAVEYRRAGRVHRVAASREIIVCAGAFGSPKLLQLSGIGPAAVLRAAGVELLVDLPGVGANLTDHPMLVMKPKVTVPTLNSELGPMGYLRGAVDWLFRGSGLATSTLGHAVGYTRSCAELSRPDLFLAFSPFAYDVTDAGVRFPAEPMVTMGVGLCRPGMRGNVSIRSASVADPPRIALEYLADDNDRAALMAGYRLLQELATSPPFRALLAETPAPRTPDLSVETFTMFHPCGTCRMGPDSDDDAVLDGELRVRGVHGLRVVDASAMPAIPSGNLHAPVIMLAEKAASMISANVQPESRRGRLA